MQSDDTIVAVSSAAGPAARMIVRVSGPLALDIARQLATADTPGDSAPPAGGSDESRNSAAGALLGSLRFADLVCPVWIYRFISPRSYTGENLVEYHLPGNPVLVRLLLRELELRGLRKAEPGEFTARAYFNGRMDLTAAEGVAATIAAGSEQELAAARRLLAGELTRRLAPAMDLLTGTLALLEVGIDFSDEDVSFLSEADLRRRIGDVSEQMHALLAESARFEQLAHEPSFVLVGRPNAGKSSLLNALAGYERAVASPVAGTTRDALAVTVSLPRGRVRVIDVAGVEEDCGGVAEWRVGGVGNSDEPAVRGEVAAADEVRRLMRERAVRAVAEADFVLLVQPCDVTPAGGAPDDIVRFTGVDRRADLVVASKSDLWSGAFGGSGLPVSVVRGDGLAALRMSLDALAFGRAGSEARLALNLRHVHAIEHALESLARAADLAGGAVELCAAELRDALDALGQVLGHVSPDDLIGRIFSQFCIGK